MRILAIRGSKLASLAAEFAIDFTQEPLASSGLFAISGPTGSGKSTLLDALCLALYDCTPRLSRGGGRGANLPDVRDETIGAQDPRGLLRRGAHEAYAEVDFVGNDGVPYRSRWTVRRARSRADGRLQASEMRLLRLTDRRALGGTKTEVLAEIQARLGLSFEQFTRAVLLAQNEFATFLKADDNERAELLETLTGTDTFTGISRRAFERCKAEQETLRAMRDQQAECQPLNAPARAELESAKASIEQVLAGLDKARTEAETGLRWHAEFERARDAETQAATAAQHAAAAVQSAAPRRACLAAIEATQEGRPLLNECDRAAAACADGEAALLRAEQAVMQCEQARAGAAAEMAAAREQRRVAEGRRLAAKPALDRARSLDAEIEQLRQHRTETDEARVTAEHDARQAHAAITAKQTEAAEVSTAYAETVAWMATNAGSEALAVEWPRWHTLLEHAAKLRTECRSAESEIGRQKRQADDARRTHAETTEQLAAAQRHSGEAERSFARAAAALSKFDATALAASKKSAEAARDRHCRGEQLWRALFDGIRQQREIDRSAAVLQTAIEAASRKLAELEQRVPAALAALEQADRSLRAAELAAAESVAELRSGLVPGTPCPVCGAVQHPWATHQPPLDTLLASLRAETARCRENLLGLRTDIGSQRTRLAGAEAQLATLGATRPSVEAALRTAREHWDEFPQAPELAAVGDEDRAAWFAARQAEAQARLDELATEEQAWHAALAERDAARARLETSRAQRHAAEQQEATAAAAAERTALGVTTAQAAMLALEQKLAAVLDDLAPPLTALPQWREDWRGDPEAFHRRAQGQAETYRQQQARVGELRRRAELLAAEIAALQYNAAKAEADAETRRTEFQRVDDRWKTATAARRQLFSGRPIEAVDTELQAAADAAAADMEHRTKVLQQAEQALAHATAIRAANFDQREAAMRAYAAANTALCAWLATCPASPPTGAALDVDGLRELLGHDAAWIAAERTALTALDAAAQRTAAVLQERRARRETIDRQRPTDQPAAALQARLNAANDALAMQRKRLAEHEVKLLQDDERRRKAEALTAAVADQEVQVLTWSQLNELIGSADGKKFRNFAQQLTLDVLLAYANRHLADLSRRYRLERIPDTLGLMVVDQDMADEIRSVHSLSGGETFLVSLGLALGLASLSSNRVRVESLFVDEGFGSLDAETLATAMDALDCLQAQGRKVGVISHVREMTERIGTQIQVKRMAGGQSRIEVVG